MNEIFREAFAKGDVQKVASLIAGGADIRYCDENGYDALISAAYASDAFDDEQLFALLALLIENGVALTGMSSYGETAVRVLSHNGRFDAVRFLLDSGASPDDLKLTPLIEAVAFGTLADVEAALAQGAILEETDGCERTALLVAVQTGDIAKAKLLLDRGARSDARGYRGWPALFYAIGYHRNAMMAWLLEIGIDIRQIDDFGHTALVMAVQCGNAEAVGILLRAGVDINQKIRFGGTALATAVQCGNKEVIEILLRAGVDINQKTELMSALWHAETREVAVRLLDAGADPLDLSFEGRRAILGLSTEADRELLTVSVDEFQKDRLPRFGGQNPERMNNPFWEGMIRSGLNAYQAEVRVMDDRDYSARIGPVWCADRFGQSLTFLPDGRIVQVAGEHEDGSDPDFCIYNDVFVHDPGGEITIYGYPEAVFPPTDFHTATLVGRSIYLIGSLGYWGARKYGATPVYRLDTETFRIELLETAGRNPGWIYEHRAVLLNPNTIQITGGKVVTKPGVTEAHSENGDTFMLDLETLAWR
jgi:ankyrin repeat protein